MLVILLFIQSLNEHFSSFPYTLRLGINSMRIDAIKIHALGIFIKMCARGDSETR